MTYLHVDVSCSGLPKRGITSGDVVRWGRSVHETTVVVADGLGCGPRANVAATLCVSRIFGLLDGGTSPRDAFLTLARSMHRIRDASEPYAVFTLIRIRTTGEISVMSYEMPEVLHLTRNDVTSFRQKAISLGDSLAREGYGVIGPGEGILVVTDGITQADAGRGVSLVGATDRLRHFVGDELARGVHDKRLISAILSRASGLWGPRLGDDCTVALVAVRRGSVVNLLTGPPGDRAQDGQVVDRWLDARGHKVICGGATAEMVARHLGRPLRVRTALDRHGPPGYALEGVDLVTEGALTLNRTLHLLGSVPEDSEDDGAGQLARLLERADRVQITVGSAQNPANRQPAFWQQGILTRQVLIPLIRERLESAGKLVVVEAV